MDQKVFNEIAAYAMSRLDPADIDYCWHKIGQNHLYSLTDEVECGLQDAVEEWFEDNGDEYGLSIDDFYDNYDLMDIWDWDPDTVDESVNESYSDHQCEHSAQTNGAMLEGLQGMINLMRNYDEYRNNALKELTDYYAKLGIKVISATPSTDGDGFSLKLDRSSVMEYLTKNGCKYDIFDENEPIGEYVCDDLEELTVSQWKDCGKNIAILFSTLWMVSERYNAGSQTRYKPEGDLLITMQQENAIDIEYTPGIYEAMDEVLHILRNNTSDENILNSRKFA